MCFDLDYGEIDLSRDSDHASLVAFSLWCGIRIDLSSCSGLRRHKPFVFFRAIQNMSIRNDISLGIDDYSGADGSLPPNYDARLAPIALLSRAVAGNNDLYDSRGHALNQRF